MRRREFLKYVPPGMLSISLDYLDRPGDKSKKGYLEKPLPRRPLGKTKESLSIVGLGGVVLANEDQELCNQIVKEAIEYGVNYFDVAPSYGNAEERMGPALKPYRKKIFLACKTQKRDKEGAQQELHQSLARLQTDYIDLYQLHALSKIEDLDEALGPNGALETFLKAKEAGKIRFLGFSAHSVEAALEAIRRFDFDTVLFPVNFACYYKGNFGPQILSAALKKNMGILAIKALARQVWPAAEMRKEWPKCWYQPITDPEESELALRFTLSQPVTAIIPPGDPRLFKNTLNLAIRFKPITSEEESKLRQLANNLNPIFITKPS